MNNTLRTPELLESLQTSPEGLKQQEAEKRLLSFGENVLEERGHKGFFNRMLEQFSDKMILILLGAAVISGVHSVITGESWADSALILIIVFLNAVIGVIQESKAEKAVKALAELSAPEVAVKRDGSITRLPVSQVVPGDIVVLSYGDTVPADGRILQSNELLVDESALTGESREVAKSAAYCEGVPVTERRDTVFASTAVRGGSAEVLITSTGMDTAIGSIAKMLNDSGDKRTPLQKRLSKTSVLLGNCALAICGIIFVVGLFNGQPPQEMFLTSVSLAVAAIPEGLPAIVTVILSLGVRRMAARGAIVRRMSAVETLGSAQVICTDKTGTLTQNRMSVVRTSGDENLLKKLGAMICDGTNPTDRAIRQFCGDTALGERVRLIPFNSDRKMMTVVRRDGDGYITVTKGAPDVVSRICRQSDMSAVEKMTEDALRVIAVAYKRTNSPPSQPESELTFVGLFGLSDPPRPEAKPAVELCKRAGIRPIMITGDYVGTAVAIARECGIYNGHAFTQRELEKMNEKERSRAMGVASVFARTTPQYKLTIIEELKKRSLTVAMTGDGVNDAPALKRADIGCAMGSGTGVAREAADMILTDDNFATVVEAVKAGRCIYSNLRKAVHFLLSCNIGELLTVFAAIAAGLPAPLNAMQLLWVNLITDSLPAVALGMEKADTDVMNRAPAQGEIIDGKLMRRIASEGIFIGLLSLCAYLLGSFRLGGPVVGSTMAFAVLSMSQLFHAFNMKSGKPLLLSRPFNNIYLLASFVICTTLLVGVIQIPAAAALFGLCGLPLSCWSITLGLSLAPIIFCDIIKLLRR